MSKLLVLAPLRIEKAALSFERSVTLIRTGMGPDRARIAAARALAHDADAVAVAGLCAGISPGLRAGDVICASELVTEDGARRPLAESALLIAVLRRRGLTVHVGPLLSAERLLHPPARAALARELGDLLGVDMESAWLAKGAGERPFAVVRVVADAAGRHLGDPRMLRDGTRALRSLSRVAAGLAEWAAITGPRTGRPSLGTIAVEKRSDRNVALRSSLPEELATAQEVAK